MTDAWSITHGYHDAGGAWHDTEPDVRAALAGAMGADQHELPPPVPPMRFVAAGQPHPLPGPADVVLEDGAVLASLTELPPDLPLGYHTVRRADSPDPVRLVVTPRRCPEPGRAWGWATQLYALRSTASWGMGDLADLRRLASWTTSVGGGVVMINPLHATAPVPDQQPSPYYAASRV